MSVRIQTAIVVAGLTAFMPDAAPAQSLPRSELAAGYSFQAIIDRGDFFPLPAGWFVSAAHAIGSSPVAIVEQAVGNYALVWDRRASIHTVGAGLRITASARTGTKQYLEVLGGLMIGGVGALLPYVEPGGGVDAPLSGGGTIRLGVAFPTAFTRRLPISSVRLHLGAVIPLGT